jgi:hypothetical protein
MTQKPTSDKENRHAVSDADLCEKMRIKYGFGNLKTIEPTKDPILKCECVFEGEQVTFDAEDGDDE